MEKLLKALVAGWNFVFPDLSTERIRWRLTWEDRQRGYQQKVFYDENRAYFEFNLRKSGFFLSTEPPIVLERSIPGPDKRWMIMKRVNPEPKPQALRG